ncbi:MAG TPA: hypothetical protein VNT52_12825 [Acidimicrobiales bacterium]|nr:hypothetical protein [Acidimicrobiales bacterium]
MGVMIGFGLGYLFGTRAGAEAYEEMTDALKTIFSSGELKTLAGGAISVLADVVQNGTNALGQGPEAKLRRIA